MTLDQQFIALTMALGGLIGVMVGVVVGLNLAEKQTVLRSASRVACAWHDGFMAGLERARWDDASDWAILAGEDYALGRTMPKLPPRHDTSVMQKGDL